MLNNYYSPIIIYKKAVSGYSDGTYTLRSGNYTGFVQPLRGNEQYKSGKGGEDCTAILYTGLNTVVEYLDKIIYKGQNYIALYTLQPQGISGTGHHKEILLGAFK